MGFLQRIFGLGKQKDNSTPPNNPNPKPQPIPRNENVIKLLEFKRMMEGILQENRYIAKSDYIDKLQEFVPVFKVFDALRSSDMLESFCKINGIPKGDAYFVMDLYTNTSEYIDKHNDGYISQAMEDEKEYLMMF